MSELTAPEAGGPLLEVRGLRTGYGSVEVLHGVDLSAQAGSILAVLGPNGAGKSTLLRSAALLHPVWSGQVWAAGRDVTGMHPEELARAGVALVPEGRGVFPSLTVVENLSMVAGSRPRPEVEERAFGRFPGLADRRLQAAGSLSGGEQRMLALARALVAEPAVLLVDELSFGLAPAVVAGLYAALEAEAADGVAVVAVEQYAHLALSVAAEAVVLVSGRVALAGSPAAVTPQLSEVYLGGA